MGGAFDDALLPTAHYHKIRGRAAEIARGRGSWIILAEHFFLGMVHDGEWWSMKVLYQSVDLGEVESAVLAVLDDPCYALPPSSRPPGAHDPERVWGVGAARRLGHNIITVDHAFLEMIRQRDTVPARALVSLGLDLDAVDAAVIEAMNAPTPVPDDAVFLPAGQELDELMKRAIRDALPRGAGVTVGRGGNRPWLKVTGPCDVTELLNTALAALGRPTLS